MAKSLKAGGLLLLVGAMVWLVTLWQWDSTQRDVSMEDLVVQLLLLPVLLVAVLLFAGWSVQRIRHPAPTVKSPSSATGTDGGAVSGADDAPPLVHAWVRASAVDLPAGNSPSAVLRLLSSGAGTPALDAELTDSQGLPIFSARGALDDDLASEPLLAPGADDRWPALSDGLPWSIGARRALVRLSRVLAQLLAELEAVHADADSDRPAETRDAVMAQDTMPSHLSGVARPVTPAMVRAQADRAPMLTVRLVLPTAWRDAEREGAQAWLRERSAALLDWAQAARAQGIRWVADAVPEPEDLCAQLEQLMLQWQRELRPQACLILACDSLLDEDRVAQWEATGALFTSHHQLGRIPGEAAAGVLLLHPCWPGISPEGVDTAGGVALVQLLRPVCAQRDKSADAVGRIGHQPLQDMLHGAWASLNVPPDQAAVLLADADHRASRTGELLGALQDAEIDLDPSTQVVRLGTVCGDVGGARPLLSLAMAAGALVPAGGEAQAALAVLVHSPRARVVWPLRCPPPSSIATPDAASPHA